VVLGAVFAVLLMWQIGAANVPYVMLSPGLTLDVLGSAENPETDKEEEVIQVTGAPTSTSAGQLRMLTVSVHSSMDLLTALRGWISGEDAVVPRELVYPPDQSEEEIKEQNEDDFVSSQSSAETVALRELGYPVKVTVTEVVAGGPAEGKLVASDVIDTVDGVQITSSQKLVELLRAKPAGTTFTIGYTRAGTAATTTVTTAATSPDDSTPRIGVSAKNEQPHPFEVKFVVDGIGGPSAGMMFTLGIIDKLDPADLTGGNIIAGTGTIDDEGRVGPIGGVPQKLYAARDVGSKVFLTPADNCEEAKANAIDGLQLVRIATIDDALDTLKKIREGGDLPSC
jgi:PDZ domain-containing protein